MAADQQHGTSDPGGAADSVQTDQRRLLRHVRCSHSAGSYFSSSCPVLEQDLAFLYEEKSADKKRWYCKI